MKVLIPSPLRPYTGQSKVEAGGGTLAAVLDELESRYPGIRFRMIDEQERIRPHMRFFIDGEQVRDLTRAVGPNDELMIVQALSGG